MLKTIKYKNQERISNIMSCMYFTQVINKYLFRKIVFLKGKENWASIYNFKAYSKLT
jgi:hypothetical protein